MKTAIVKKAQGKLSLNSPNYVYSEEILGIYFDDAIDIIVDWKRLSDVDSIISGIYDKNIVQFIIESIVISGMEGQSSNSSNGNKKVFIASPESNLKSSIPQSI